MKQGNSKFQYTTNCRSKIQSTSFLLQQNCSLAVDICSVSKVNCQKAKHSFYWPKIYFHFSFKGLKYPNDPYQTKFDTKPFELYKTPFQEYPSHVGIFNSFFGNRQDVVFGNIFSMRTGILAAIAILVNFVGMFLSFLILFVKFFSFLYEKCVAKINVYSVIPKKLAVCC